MMNKWYWTVFVLVFFVFSCDKSENIEPNNLVGQQDVLFSTKIAGQPQTRATGNQWDVNDSIGVFMYAAGTALVDSIIINDGFNRMYRIYGNGNFIPAHDNQSLHLPDDGAVNFAAFYPYRNISGFIQRLDISNQHSQPAIDFMYAVNTSGIVKGQGPVSLVNTSHFLGKPIRTFSGLSCYLPIVEEEAAHSYYLTLEWATHAGFNLFF